MKFSRLLCTGAVALMMIGVAQAEEPLRSPWDTRTVTLTGAQYDCPSVEPLPQDIEAFDFYSDAKHSVIDPVRFAAYNKAQERFRGTTAAAEDAADNFQKSGSREAAACIVKLLLPQAEAKAMTGKMASNQSYYVQNWTIGALAVTWLKVRQAAPGTAEQRAKILDWMETVARSTKNYFTDRHLKQTKDGTNNHYYWAGFAVMSVGLATNDRKYFDWGVETYNDAMSRVQPDGTLPLEMDRGQRALHYHLFALGPLVLMAEFAAANHVDLYNANHGALHLLIKRSLAGLINNSYFAQKAGVPQDTPEKGKIKAEDVLWITPYLRRYPDADAAKLLNQAPVKPIGYLGGLPPAGEYTRAQSKGVTRSGLRPSALPREP